MLRFVLLGLAVGAAGCASTTVKKDPGPHDRGVRYYRPKPYLSIKPAEGSTESVAVSVEYLPDFSEEYSIHVRAGLGLNNTTITLEEGWKLTSLGVELDQNVDDNLNALANLLTSAGGLAKPASQTEKQGADPKTLMVRATNVPFGYYESVISPGPDGRKRLYGWRYVGFAPYLQCPVDAGGADCLDCHSAPLYGLVMREGVMTFVPLGAAAAADPARVEVRVAKAADSDRSAAADGESGLPVLPPTEFTPDVRAKLQAGVAAALGGTLGQPVTAADIDIGFSAKRPNGLDGTVVYTIKVPAARHEELVREAGAKDLTAAVRAKQTTLWLGGGRWATAVQLAPKQ